MLPDDILEACRRLGFKVALSRLPDGSVEATAERDGHRWVATVEYCGEDTAYLAAVQLVELVGIDVEEG